MRVSYSENTVKNSQKSRPRVKIREILLKLQRNRSEEKFSQERVTHSRKPGRATRKAFNIYIFLSNWLYFAAGWNTEVQSKWDELSFFPEKSGYLVWFYTVWYSCPSSRFGDPEESPRSDIWITNSGMTLSLPEPQDKSEALDKILISDNFSSNSSSSEIFRMEYYIYFYNVLSQNMEAVILVSCKRSL